MAYNTGSVVGQISRIITTLDETTPKVTIKFVRGEPPVVVSGADVKYVKRVEATTLLPDLTGNTYDMATSGEILYPAVLPARPNIVWCTLTDYRLTFFFDEKTSIDGVENVSNIQFHFNDWPPADTYAYS